MWTTRLRQKYSRLAVGVTLLSVLGACGADEPSTSSPPSNETLTRLCEQVPDVVREGLEAASNPEYQIDGDVVGDTDQLAGCASMMDYWVYADGPNADVGVWLGFYAATDSGPAQDDYCQTAGVHVKQRAETGEFSGGPFCLSWDGSNGRQLISSSYLDNGAVVSIIWTVSDYDADIEAQDDPVATLVLKVNNALLEFIHDGLNSK